MISTAESNADRKTITMIWIFVRFRYFKKAVAVNLKVRREGILKNSKRSFLNKVCSTTKKVKMISIINLRKSTLSSAFLYSTGFTFRLASNDLWINPISESTGLWKLAFLYKVILISLLLNLLFMLSIEKSLVVDSSNDEINEKSAETQIPTSQISSRKVGIPNSKTMVYNSVD